MGEMLKLTRAKDKTPVYIAASAITAVMAPWPQGGYIDVGNSEVWAYPKFYVQVIETPEEIVKLLGVIE